MKIARLFHLVHDSFAERTMIFLPLLTRETQYVHPYMLSLYQLIYIAIEDGCGTDDARKLNTVQVNKQLKILSHADS